MGSNLSSTDIDLLKAIRDINLNPGEYEETDGGDVPATTTAIREATDLSRSQITYRSAPSQGGYMGEDGRGLVEIHDAQVDDETSALGPKSLELTQKGVDALSEYTRGMEATDNKSHTRSGSSSAGEISTADEREVIRQLHTKIQSLEAEVQNENQNVDVEQLKSEIQRVESRLDELRRKVHTMGQAEWGAVDGEKTDNLERVLSRAPAMMYAFTILLEIDIDEIVDMGGYDDTKITEVRQNLFSLLNSAATHPRDAGDSEAISSNNVGGKEVDDRQSDNESSSSNDEANEAVDEETAIDDDGDVNRYEPPSFSNLSHSEDNNE